MTIRTRNAVLAALLIAGMGILGGCAVGYSSKDGWYGRVEVKPEDIRGFQK